MSILNTRVNEFEKAKSLFEEYKESVHQVAIGVGLFDTEGDDFIRAESRYQEWELEVLGKVYQAFDEEYRRLTEQGIYFFGCPIDIYERHLDTRKESYSTVSKNSNEIGFILNEFAIGKLDFDNGICDIETANNIEVNLKLRYNLLLEKLTSLGYNMEGMLDVDRASKSRISPMEVEIDLSDSNDKQKVIFLNELGIIEHLKVKFKKANLSNNKIAQLLSSFTGVKPSTMQSYINPLLNKADVINQYSNPYSNQRNVDKVRTILKTDFNLNLPEIRQNLF